MAERLLSWDHSGFSVYAEQTVLPHERDRLARLARYMARAPLPNARLREGPDGRLLVRTGSGEVAFSPVDLIHALAQQIPDKGQHLVRYYGAYANRARRLYRAEKEGGGRGGREDPCDVDSEFARERSCLSRHPALFRRVLDRGVWATTPREPRGASRCRDSAAPPGEGRRDTNARTRARTG